MAKIIDGKEIARKVLLEVEKEVIELGRRPVLGIVQVGDNPASVAYVRNKLRAARSVGIETIHEQLPVGVNRNDLRYTIIDIQEHCDGVIVQLPLPGFPDPREFVYLISPFKDVDGLTPYNQGCIWTGDTGLFPCTAMGVVRLLKETHVDLTGMSVTIFGRSSLVGKPLAGLLLREDAVPSIMHSHSRVKSGFSKQSDIVVVAIGQPKFLGRHMVKRYSTIIDVGINKVDSKLVGDVDFEGMQEWVDYITPVPGGVGPMTVAYLMKNVVKAARIMAKPIF